MNSYIQSLMSSKDIELIKEDDNYYGIRVLGRGLNLFFRENDKGLICCIEAEHGVIYAKSIKIWGTENKSMDEKEKNRVLQLIVKYYKLYCNPNVIVSESKNY